MPTDLIATYMAAAVVNVVGNVVVKVIDQIWTQPQAHRFHREEQNAQHQLRLEELKKQYEYSIIKSFSDSRIKINEQQIIEHLKASYSISTNKAIRNFDREDANSPFFDGIEKTYQTLKILYEKTKLPIILVAPFWDDTKPIELNYKGGGFVNFRNAFNISYNKVSWSNLAFKQDGYLKRPLYQTDRDVNYIYKQLSDIPIILVHGTIQGVNSLEQHVQRIHPHITFWNLFPEQQDSYTSLNLRFFPLKLPIGKNNSPDIYQQIGEYGLDLQDTVGKYLTKAIGLLSSFYHLYHFETRPNLQQFQLENELELEILLLQISDMYDFLSQRNPPLANYYKFQRDILFLECEIDEIRRRKNFTQDHNYSLKLEATEVRCWLANQFLQMAKTISQFEKQVTDKGVLSLSSLVDNLKEAIRKLLDMKFSFLIIGDLNRGKSTIVNVLLKQELLPMGVASTTAIPTFVKYGEQQKVLVHKNDGSKKKLSREEYEQGYSLNSKKVRNQIRSSYKSEEEWLNHLDYAEFYYPIELLLEGVEFIDTPALNIKDIQAQKIFTPIQESHVILFVLSADQPFNHKEKKHLHNLLFSPNQIKKPIFYLINKWDNLKKDEQEEIHETFVEEFCECLEINEDEAEKMWGDTVFDVYAKTALGNLRQGKSIDGTGLEKFKKRLDDFILNERLKTELSQAIQIAELVKVQVASKVNERLILLKDNKVDHEEAQSLQVLVDDISAQLKIMEAKYNEIISDFS